MGKPARSSSHHGAEGHRPTADGDAAVRDMDFEFRSRMVFEALRQLRKLSFRQLQADLYGQGKDALEPAQYDALDLLLTDNEWRMTDFAKALRVDSSTATRMVDRLVQAGVAIRKPSRTDGRGINIRATRLDASVASGSKKAGAP